MRCGDVLICPCSKVIMVNVMGLATSLRIVSLVMGSVMCHEATKIIENIVTVSCVTLSNSGLIISGPL